MLLAWTEPSTDAARETKARGYSISRGERNRHLDSIAIPVLEGDGDFPGVVTITGMAADLEDTAPTEFADVVTQEMARAGFETATRYS